MHIASGLAVLRRAPSQSDVAVGRSGQRPSLTRLDGVRLTGRRRRWLPGAILLTLLVAIGAAFPLVF